MKLYDELGLESLKFRRWFRKLCLSYKIKKIGLPEHLFSVMPQSNPHYKHSVNEGCYDILLKNRSFQILFSIYHYWNGTNLTYK